MTAGRSRYSLSFNGMHGVQFEKDCTKKHHPRCSELFSKYSRLLLPRSDGSKDFMLRRDPYFAIRWVVMLKVFFGFK